MSEARNTTPTATAERPELHGSRLLPVAAFWGFTAALLAVIVMAIATYLSLEARSASSSRMRHTLDVLQHLELLLSALKDAETGQRGFLLTGESVYLTPYETAGSTIASEESRVRSLVSDNPQQRAALIGIEHQIDAKLAELKQTIELAKHDETKSALELVRSGAGRRSMNVLRASVDQMKETERQQLAETTAEWEQSAIWSLWITIGGSLLLVTLILYSAHAASKNFRERTAQMWLRAGQTGLALESTGGQQFGQVMSKTLAFVAQYLEAQIGALYTVELDGALTRRATYAFAPDDAPGRSAFTPGDGLVGQAALTRRTLELRGIPPDYLKVRSGLGDRAPLSVLVVPASADQLVNSVIELGFLRPLLATDRQFIELVSEQIGAVVRTAQYRARLEELLAETQRQTEELQSQQEELRVSNEELEEQSRALQESHVRLENQQSELEQINAQLEEQAQLVESQKDELSRSQSALIEKNADLERVNQYKNEFLANMSHELRTPLNSSLILAKLLSENKTGNLSADQIRFAETIYAAGNDLLTLINDVLDLSKIEAGKIELQIAPLEIGPLLRSIVPHFEPLATEKQLHFAVAIEDSAPKTIESDRQRLEQILKNLLSNAIKFSDRGEVVLTVSAAADGGTVFAVRDTGIGIAKHQQELIFDAFHQADSTTARKYGGTGLGLSISRDLAALLGGELVVQSEVGKGSTFTLRLPRQAPSSVAPAQLPSGTARLVAERSPTPVASATVEPIRRPPPPAATNDKAWREAGSARRI